jgi:hypothetical protein
MIDSPGAFKSKLDAMFDKADQEIQETAREFVRLVAVDLVVNTPGFGNQRPDDTEYIPTGRLRGGWNWSLSKFEGATRFDGGPHSDYGVETIERIAGQLQGHRMGGKSYLENDVAYGGLIVRGEGLHSAVGPRNWPYETYLKMGTFAQQARRRA